MIIIFTYILKSRKVGILDLLAIKKYHQKIYYKMSKAIFKVPTPVNEKVKEYKKDSEELKSLLHEYDEMYKKTIDVPMIIGGNEVTTQEKINIVKHLRRSKIIFNASFFTILDDFAKKVDERTFLFMWDGKLDKIEKCTITADRNKGGLK